ncbi:MAG: alpha-ketoglutarate-dependent dioxygenase AlkB [Pseudomonadota bacterium]
MMIDGFRYLPGYLSIQTQLELIQSINDVILQAPLYRPTMPRSGKPFSVKMTNCGPLGWVSSKDEGYRYQSLHPELNLPWPAFPPQLLKIWHSVAHYAADPEACLINWYDAKSKLGLHVDADEKETAAPVVSISLGDNAWFRIGGLKRGDPTQRLLVKSGDVIVLGGPARLAHHGIDRILPNTSKLFDIAGRYNLTMRRINMASE